MFCNWGINIFEDIERKLRDKELKVSPGAWYNFIIYEEDGGINSGVGSEEGQR